MTQKEIKQHRLWPRFVEWAGKNGVDLVYFDDWGAWWQCFLAGAIAARTDLVGE